ncbi:XRE family transcriptional regulator [Streptomyces sp. NPDC001073]
MRDPRAALAETLDSIDRLRLKMGRSREDVLNVNELAQETTLSPDVVAALLNGQEVSEEAVGSRIRARLLHLRETHRRSDGKRYSYSEIGESFGSSGAAISAIVNGSSRNGPLAATQAGIEKFFFGRANGFLSAEAAPTLDAALQPVLKALERDISETRSTPLSEFDDVRGIALRHARDLPEEQWNVLNATLEALLRLDDNEEAR